MKNYFILIVFFINSQSFAGMNQSRLSHHDNLESADKNYLNKKSNSLLDIPVISVYSLFADIINNASYQGWKVIIPHSLNQWLINNSISLTKKEMLEFSLNMFAHSLTEKPVLISDESKEFFTDLNLPNDMNHSLVVALKYGFFPESVLSNHENEGPFFFYLVKNLSNHILEEDSCQFPLTLTDQNQWIKNYKENYKLYHSVSLLILRAKWAEVHALLEEMPNYSIPELHFRFAQQLLDGMGCEKNIQKGLEELKIAIKQGHFKAINFGINFSIKNPEFNFLLKFVQPSILEPVNFSPFLSLPLEIQAKIINQFDSTLIKNFRLASKKHDPIIKKIRTVQNIKIPNYYTDPNSVIYSPDFTKFALVSSHNNKNEIRVFGINDENYFYRFLEGHQSEISSSVFLPNNKTLITGDKKGVLKIWDVDQSKCVHTSTAHENFINKIISSKNGLRVLTSSLDNTIKVWDVQLAKVLSSFSCKGVSSYMASFSSDGKRVLSLLHDEDKFGSSVKIVIWDAETGQLIQTLNGDFNLPESISFSSDGSKILVVLPRDNNHLEIWDSTSGELLKNLIMKNTSIHSASFSPNDKKIAVSRSDGHLEVFDSNSMQRLYSLENENFHYIYEFAFSPDSKKIITFSNGNTFAKVWDMDSGSFIVELYRHDFEIQSAFFSSVSNRVATFSKGEIKMWNLSFF